jgi:hypothetical protein
MTFDDNSNKGNGPKPPGSGDLFDPARLRLSQDFAGGQAVKKILTTVPVRKPDRQWFVRTRPGEDWRLPTGVIEIKEDRETYLVEPEIALAFPNEIVPILLVTAITRHGVPFLWPNRLPGEDGKQNEWHRSLLEAAQRAEEKWVRVVANMAVGSYEVYEATGPLPEPEWPDLTFSQLLRIAFKDRFIQTRDHPVLRRLRGEV